MVISLAGISRNLSVRVLFLLPAIGLGLQATLAAGETDLAASIVVSSADSIEQALLDVTSEDAVVRSKAVALLIEKGDASLVPKLDAIRAEADRAVRIAIKPVIDLLKNRANLTSEQPDTRRSAAADLVGTGRPEAITWLE